MKPVCMPQNVMGTGTNQDQDLPAAAADTAGTSQGKPTLESSTLELSQPRHLRDDLKPLTGVQSHGFLPFQSYARSS